MSEKRYRIVLRNGQSFILWAHNEDEAWNQARKRMRKYQEVRGKKPAEVIKSIEADV
jgi:hypothetical protein